MRVLKTTFFDDMFHTIDTVIIDFFGNIGKEKQSKIYSMGVWKGREIKIDNKLQKYICTAMFSKSERPQTLT